MDPFDASLLERDIVNALEHHDLVRAAELAGRYRRDVPVQEADGDPEEALWFRARYLSARADLATGQPSSALEGLRPLLGITHRLPVSLACHIHLLAADAFSRRRRFDEAREQLATVRAEPSWGATVDASPLLRLYELRVRLRMGQVASMKEELNACKDALHRKRDVANEVLLLTQEGRAWDNEGDLSQAERCWLEALGLFLRRFDDFPAADGQPWPAVLKRLGPAPPPHPAHADLFLQFGRLAHPRGQLQDALDCYEAARRLSPPGSAQALNVELRRLMVLYDVNREKEARREWKRLFGLVSPGDLPEEVGPLAAVVRGVLSDEGPATGDAEVEAHRALHRGDRDIARRLYEQALADEKSPERQARLAVALGLLFLPGEAPGVRETAGDEAQAERWLARAGELADAHELPEVRRRVLQARGRLALRRGVEQEGLPLLAEADRLLHAQADSLRDRRFQQSYRRQAASVYYELLRDACHKGDAARVFRFQELIQGRRLIELWQGTARHGGPSPVNAPRLLELNERLEQCEARLAELGDRADVALRRLRTDLLAEHEALCESYLEDPSRPASAALPGVPTLEELQRALRPGAVYVAPALIGKDLFVLAVRPRDSRVLRYPDATAEVDRQLRDWRQRLGTQLELCNNRVRLGLEHRRELDACLQALGDGPLGNALEEVWTAGPGERLVWSPGAGLAGLPVHALRRDGRYLIEDHEVVQAFSGGLLVQQARLRRPPRWRRRRALVVTGDPNKKLQQVEREGEGVAEAFPWRKHVRDEEATRDAIRPLLPRVGVAHFACHAYFNPHEPLAARLELPSGQEWLARGWWAEPFAGLPLATLSACGSGKVAPVEGGEVFGLVYGLLGAGVRAVIGGLWDVPELGTPPLMWRFYRERMTADLATALARAQRETLADEGSSPFFWAVFALFGDAAALPEPGWLGRWWARRRQRRHASLYPPPS